MTLLLEESVNAENIWRPIVAAEHPVFSHFPVERVPPNPKSKRHWMFATNNDKILAHINKPEEVIRRYAKAVTPLLGQEYGVMSTTPQDLEEITNRIIQDTITYLFFHELFHPVYCPKSKTDEQLFDVALKNGIKRAEPHLSPRDLINKTGNARNSMWDLFIDTFFKQYSSTGEVYDTHLQKRLAQEAKTVGGNQVTKLPDGIVTAWDIAELVDEPPKTLFYPITRAMYALLQCNSKDLRQNVFDYFREGMGKRISDADLEKAVTGSLAGAVRFLKDTDLQKIGIDRSRYLDSVDDLYENNTLKANTAREYVVKAITEIGIRTELRYAALEGIIDPLAKYIDVNKEEKRDGAYTDDEPQSGNGQQQQPQSGSGQEPQQGSQGQQSQSGSGQQPQQGSHGQQPQSGSGQQPQQGSHGQQPGQSHGAQGQDAQTPTSQTGGGAEAALESLIAQNDPDVNSMLEAIANDQSSPQTQRNIRLSNLAKDEYYKRHAKEIPIKSPQRKAVTRELGKRRVPRLVRTQLLAPEELINVNVDQIMDFQTLTGIQCLTQLSPHQYQLDHYKWVETPIRDFEYVKTGIDLPANIILRVDGSGSMTTTPAFVGTGNRYDALMHVVYGIAKSADMAAAEMKKQVQVIAVSYSRQGLTRISEPVELRNFYATPNNSAKQVLLNPAMGGTWHDLDAYDAAHNKCKPGKTLDIIITDGDLDTPHDTSLAEIQSLLQHPETGIAYFTIFEEGAFAKRIKLLGDRVPNLKYQHFPNMNGLQAAGTSLVVQYARQYERFGG